MAKNRVDTDSMFKRMISPLEKQEEQEPKEVKKPVKNNEGKVQTAKAGRKPDKEKKIQVSIYLTPEQAKELRVQNALKVKEQDKSAIARAGIDIVLGLSDEEYLFLKREAEQRKISPCEVVKGALSLYQKQ